MKKKGLILIIPLIIFLLCAFKADEISIKDKDKVAIKKMCGCYEVEFNFVETFKYSKDKEYKPSAEKHMEALEWVELVKDEDDHLILQHLLLLDYNGEKSVMKHWRQDWIYENIDFYTYSGKDNTWHYDSVRLDNIKGEWTQKVYQVDDGPRYEGSGKWFHYKEKSFWESETDAPLPRREYTIRDDYEIMYRRSRHSIEPSGWIHEQDNDKLKLEGDKRIVLAQEKGLNKYNRVNNSKCQFAKDWWKQNFSLWNNVREEWNMIYDKKVDLKIKNKNIKLYAHLFGLDPNTPRVKTDSIIQSFIIE